MSDALVERLAERAASEIRDLLGQYSDRLGMSPDVIDVIASLEAHNLARALLPVVEQEIAAARAEALREADVTWRRRALFAEEAIRRAMRLYHEAVREGVTLQPTAIRDALALQVIEAQTPATSTEEER